MSSSVRASAAPPLVHVRRLLVVVLAALLSVGTFTLPASATPSTGLTLNVSYGTTTAPDGTTVVTPGTQYVATIQYQRSALVAGSTIVLTAPSGVTIPDSALVVPLGNTVFESLTRQSDGSIAIKVVDDLSGSSVNQGVFEMSFTMDNNAPTSEVRTLEWSLGGETQSVTLIVKKPGDEILVPFSASTAKSSSNASSLNSYVSVTGGVVTVDPAITNVKVGYTLSVNSNVARTGIDISDVIDSRMEYAASSFAANLTTWDANGLNKTTTLLSTWTPTFGAATFAYSDVSLPKDSKLVITYYATLKASEVAQLQAALQTSYDANVKSTGYGTYSVGPFTNTMSVSGVTGTKKTSFTVSRTISAPAGPNYSSAFSKSSSLANGTVITRDAAGEITAPLAVTYTLVANLAFFTGTVPALTRNVVVTDVLPAQVDWLAGDSSFLTVTDSANVPVAFTKVTGIAAADFKGDSYIGTYQVDGKNLWINLGQNSTQRYTIKVKGQIVSLAGIGTTETPTNLSTVQTQYNGPSNTGEFTFSDTIASQKRSVSRTLWVLRDPSVPITDTSKFTKTSPATVQGVSGEPILVPFTFKVSAGYDFAKSRIIDMADPDVFDLSDLDAIKAGITGTYDGSQAMTGDSFDLAIDADGYLVITPSSTFGDGWDSRLRAPFRQSMTLTVSIPTKVLEGSQTITITNSALLVGSSTDTWTYTSTAESKGTTYGDEMEVFKALYDEGVWTRNFRADVDSAGTLINDEFIYRIELLPHGSFNNVTIIPVEDALPSGLQFLGFVTDANLPAGTVESGDTIDMGGNIRAEWIDSTRTLNMYNPTGTRLNSEEPIYVNFKVKALDYTEDVSITNAIDGASATFTPSNGYPLTIQKLDADSASLLINDRAARFTVTGPAGLVTDSAYVVDGLLKVSNGKGGDKSIVVADKGTYTVTETVAPLGYKLASAPIKVTVGDDGSSPTVAYYNTRLGADETGTVSLSKTVVGGPDGSDADFTFTWTAVAPEGEQLSVAQSAGSVAVKGDGVAVPLGVTFPEGTVVTFVEGKAPYIDGYNVTDVTYSSNPVTVVGGADTEVSVVNTYTFPDAFSGPDDGSGGLASTGAENTGLRMGGALALSLLGFGLLGARRWTTRRSR